ncbi:MAG TPA: DUF4339 domain-containing protein [Verrucomicrobiae bacterium]|nr:DUF4339 domain-containing protein [Verrucomicrobiae bacterium]
MYKIIGADQKEYGPVSAEQMRQWIAEGRVNAQTQVQSEGGAEWKPLAAYPEFAASFPQAPPPSAAAAAPGLTPAPISTEAGQALARQKVNGPAIGLMITAVLGFIGAIFKIISPLTGFNSLQNLQNSNANLPPQFQQLQQMVTQMNGTMGVVTGILGLAMCVLIFYGALQMQKLTNHGLCMTASIVAMIPCLSPCCCIGLPIGIWALVVLSQADVKSSFH